MEKQPISFNDLPKAVGLLGDKLDAIQQLLTQRVEPQPTQAPDQIMTIREAAALLRLTVPTIYSKVSRGELAVMKQGNRLYFSKMELLDYLKSGRKPSNAELQAAATNYCNEKQGGRYGNK